MDCLQKSLLYLKVSELKSVCCQLLLSDKGTKIILIGRIVHFVKTGKKLVSPLFPRESYAQKGKQYPLSLNAKIKGAYKNDLQTRLFFKQIIGEYFHFTAFGIDWLNKRWMNGNPPTYQEFADMWTEEYERRKNNPAKAKQEWAYIRFVQAYIKQNSNCSRLAIQDAWKKEQQKHKVKVYKILNLQYEK